MGPDSRLWRPANFTAGLRGQPMEEPPPADRWESLLRAERSPAYVLASAAARRPWLRRLLRLPPAAGGPRGTTLDEREEHVEVVCDSWLGRLLRGPSASASADGSDGAPATEPSSSPPAVGPLLDAEVERALALLASMSFEDLQRRGWHFQPNHFYWPLNDVAFLRQNPEVWLDRPVPREIDWDLDGQEGLARELATFTPELDEVPSGRPSRSGVFFWDNGVFSGVDVYAYYGLLRKLRPRRVVEVGAGWSSLILEQALAANADKCDVTLIEPFPNPEVFEALPRDWSLVESLVQQADPALFEALQAGDLLFYDGSHCVRTGSDVNWIFFEVLPRLAPGVWVHLHDIQLPDEYDPEWILDEGLSWNEQYLLQAFLMHNESYRVRFSVRMLLRMRPELMADWFPTRPIGGSIWLEKVA